MTDNFTTPFKEAIDAWEASGLQRALERPSREGSGRE